MRPLRTMNILIILFIVLMIGCFSANAQTVAEITRSSIGVSYGTLCTASRETEIQEYAKYITVSYSYALLGEQYYYGFALMITAEGGITFPPEEMLVLFNVGVLWKPKEKKKYGLYCGTSILNEQGGERGIGRVYHVDYHETSFLIEGYIVVEPTSDVTLKIGMRYAPCVTLRKFGISSYEPYPNIDYKMLMTSMQCNIWF
jgi:hypothetical protein